jgi:hypothetical protein
MRYHWTGGNVAGQFVYAGVDLMRAGNLAEYPTTAPIDLRSGRYRLVRFDVRGALSADTVLKIEVADDGDPGTPAPCLVLSESGQDTDSTPNNPVGCQNVGRLEADWRRFTIPVTDTNLLAVKDFFKATFIYKRTDLPGSGGTVFFDNIEYLP